MNLFKKITLLSYISVASTESAMLTPAFPQIQKAFHISTGELSLLMTLFLVGYLLCQLTFGPLANRFGSLNCVRIGFLINLLGVGLGVIAGTTQHYDVLLLSRFITALGAGAGLSGTFALIHEWMPETEAKGALSQAVLSFMLGIGLGIYIGGLLSQSFGWQMVLIFMLAYAILMLASTFLFQQSAFTAQAINLHNILSSYGHSLKNLKLLRYSYILGYGTAVSYLYSTAAPLISADYLHLNASQYGRWNLVIMVGMLFGSLHCKRLLKNHAMKKLLAFGIAGFALCALALWLMFATHHDSIVGFFMIAALLYYFGGFTFPCASFFATEGANDRSGASGMMSFINMSIATIALVLLGYLPFSLLENFIGILIGGAAIAGLAYSSA